MCLSEPLTNPIQGELPDFPEDYLFPEPPDPEEEVFLCVCHRIESDLDWLEAEPRQEGDLLLRYFGDEVSRIEDLLEYRRILHECLFAVQGSYVVLLLPSTTPDLRLVWEEEYDA
jgi:hypothetical protein